MFYRDYHACRADAQALADQMNHDVAIRAVKEFGTRGFVFGLACRNDSDYDRAEIVTPVKAERR